MASISDDVFDNGLSQLNAIGDRVDICSSIPTTYAEAITTYSLGNKTAYVPAAPSDRGGGGREVICPSISDGSVTGDGTAAFFSLVDTGTTALMIAGALSASQAVTTGNTFTLTSWTVGIPDPA